MNKINDRLMEINVPHKSAKRASHLDVLVS